MDETLRLGYKLQIADIMRYSEKDENGLTTDELKRYFGDVMMKEFGKWIDGQCCAISRDGQMVIFPEDINRFVGLVFGGKSYWN